MHLLQAVAAGPVDGDEPVELGQSPAELIVLSAADSDLALLAEARAALGPESPTLRLAQLSWLKHPYSLDRYLETTAIGAKLVVARLLGGAAYWSYAFERFAAALPAAGVGFAALPGDDAPDETLAQASTTPRADWEALWGYLVEGGPENAANFLRAAARVIDPARPAPPTPAPLLRAGLYWPGAAGGGRALDLAALRRRWAEAGVDGRPVAAVAFYRALAQGAGLQPVDRLIRALIAEGLAPLPAFVASLKDPVSAATLGRLFEAAPPAVVLNATSFAVAEPSGAAAPERAGAGGRARTPLDAPGAPVLQVVLAAQSEADWAASARGLTARDVAMNVSLPEVDGRILTRAISFKAEAFVDAETQCPIARHRAAEDRVRFAAQTAAAWARLRATPPSARRVGLVLANYPTRDGRLANGVGLDTPASAAAILAAMAAAGYDVAGAPADAAALMARLIAGPTNAPGKRGLGGETLRLDAYRQAYAKLPPAARAAIEARWGAPEADPRVADGAFRLAIHRFGATALGVQPSRGYELDPAETHHSPDLPPPHGYLAFYIYLRAVFGAHALAHVGKHGNLEWLPGKATALSEACFPEAALGPIPHLYPFIVNDPGEGAQAKRRAQAVIIDHLTPPLTRAESYGPMKDLEALVDEYYEAAGVDPRRVAHLRAEILSLTQATGLDLDAGLSEDDDADSRLAKLDAYLCELKESQIRDGLHVFGAAPEGRLETDTLVALARTPRGGGEGRDASLIRALSGDLLGPGFDPLDCDMAAPWSGPRPAALAARAAEGPWRSAGDAVERLELLAARLVAGEAAPAAGWTRTAAVLEEIETRLRPALRASGPAETAALLAGLDGRFVDPGPAGAPTRGRPDTLPTGRNFYSLDSRALPTPAAWALGWRSASLLIERHAQEAGDWPRAMLLTAWGTANMRTGGDDLAQALALMGARPTWDAASRRVTGFEVLPLSALGRPRVDVTLRVSGFFRDAFPAQIELIDRAARAVMALEDESEADNPAAARARAERAAREAAGEAPEAAARAAGWRVFGAKPGAYGAGLQALIDARAWAARADLGRAYLEWGGYAYGAGAAGAEGAAAPEAFAQRLRGVEAVVQNQDNREHDLLDSDDYYQFEGGAAAAIESLRGAAPRVYHNDHSRPERPVIRTLEEEIGRVMRARVANPKWIAGVMRHGYKGAFEIAATVDYLFAFAAATDAVRDHHFDMACAAFLEDDAARGFMAEANPNALREIAERLGEAIERGLWRPRANSAAGRIARVSEGDFT